MVNDTFVHTCSVRYSDILFLINNRVEILGHSSFNNSSLNFLRCVVSMPFSEISSVEQLFFQIKQSIVGTFGSIFGKNNNLIEVTCRLHLIIKNSCITENYYLIYCLTKTIYQNKTKQ